MLLTDTVGFIRKLPHQLVEAFKSTLSVAADADLLVHVVDASALDPEGNIDAVRTVLREIDADEVPVLYAFNKADLGAERGRAAGQGPRGRRSRSAPPPARASRSCSSPIARPAARPHQRRRAGRPVRPRRRPGRGAPGGRGAQRAGRRRRHAAAGAARRRRRSASSPTTWWRDVSAEPFVPPPYPYDRLDELKAVAAALPGRARRPLDRHAVRPAAGRRWSRRSPGPAPSAATRRRSASPRYREAAAGWMARRLGVEVDPAARGRVRRHQGARRRRPAVAAAAAARPRHRALPGDQLPDLRDGRHARRLPGGAVPRSSTTSTRPTPPGRCASG